MSALSNRDKTILLLVVTILLYGGLALMLGKVRVNWQTAQNKLKAAETRAASQEKVIASRGDWQARYTAQRANIPVFPANKAVETYWLPLMDDMAKTNAVIIAQRKIDGETDVGEITELSISCRDWEGRLDSLVRFLYDLETQSDAMMDIRQLYIRPHTKTPGRLQGSFTLNCAYIRDK